MSPAAPTPRPSALSIGAVLAALRPDFPDVTISKIRFLEAEGLVSPRRTASGYRTFAESDVERLRYILSAQRDRFWPLKVIRDALDALDRGLAPVEGASGPAVPRVPAPVPDRDLPSARDLTRVGALRLTPAELRSGAALDESTYDALLTFCLLRPDSGGHFGEPELAVARAAATLAAYGIEARHLRGFRTSADREIGLVQQATAPLRGRTRGTGGTADKTSPADPTPQILAACIALHTSLVKAALAQR